jgi:hypothetical protein
MKVLLQGFGYLLEPECRCWCLSAGVASPAAVLTPVDDLLMLRGYKSCAYLHMYLGFIFVSR